MFGYVRPFKPYLRMCEYEVYRAVYCGVCKAIGRSFGQLPRFTLSYDLAFLALCDMSVNNEQLSCEPQRCIAHPLTKRTIGSKNNALERAAYIWVILVYHKLMDDITDGSTKQRIAAKAAIPFFGSAYKKARRRYERLSEQVEKQMKLQRELEKAGCDSVDRACEPTAQIMRAVFSELSDNADKSDVLGSFGYYLGRYIYLTDALDDIIKDEGSGSYNPLLQGTKGRLTKAKYRKIATNTDFSIRMTLGRLADHYVRLDLGLYHTILDNIIYLGLNDTFTQVKERRFNRKKGMTADERSV